MLKPVRLSAECYDKHFAIFILMKNIYSIEIVYVRTSIAYIKSFI